jgi:hypothetical protein
MLRDEGESNENLEFQPDVAHDVRNHEPTESFSRFTG